MSCESARESERRYQRPLADNFFFFKGGGGRIRLEPLAVARLLFLLPNCYFYQPFTL